MGLYVCPLNVEYFKIHFIFTICHLVSFQCFDFGKDDKVIHTNGILLRNRLVDDGMNHLKKDFQNKFPKWPFQFQKSQSGEDTLLLFLPPDDNVKDLDPHHIINENFEKVKSALKDCYQEIIPYCQYSKENEPEGVPKENPLPGTSNQYVPVKFLAVNSPTIQFKLIFFIIG
jgi:hypothetical protein